MKFVLIIEYKTDSGKDWVRVYGPFDSKEDGHDCLEKLRAVEEEDWLSTSVKSLFNPPV